MFDISEDENSSLEDIKIFKNEEKEKIEILNIIPTKDIKVVKFENNTNSNNKNEIKNKKIKKIRLEWDYEKEDTGIFKFNENLLKRNDRYIENNYINKSKKDESKIIREKYNIKYEGIYNIKPISYFDDIINDKYLLNTLKYNDINKPTPIQMQVIPLLKDGFDLLCISPTGSGKTLAFILPLLIYLEPYIYKKDIIRNPLSLIILPTRELAIQIYKEFQFYKNKKLKTVLLIGGNNKEENLSEIYNGVHVIIGTLGRINDCLNLKYFNLNNIRHIILDEADLIIELDLENILKDLFNKINIDNLKSENKSINAHQIKQFINHEKIWISFSCFSATMPLKLENILNNYLKIKIKILINKVNRNISQKFYFFNQENKKIDKLISVLKYVKPQTIIFVNELSKIDYIKSYLKGKKVYFKVYSSNLSQFQREKIIEDFKSNKFDILISSDLGGRGLDFKNIRTIINYDFPLNLERYIHRMGRAGRSGQSGYSISFMSPSNIKLFYELNKYLKNNDFKIPKVILNHPASKFKNYEINEDDKFNEDFTYK